MNIDRIAENAVQYALADTAQRQIQSYLQRGRAFERTSLTDLQVRFEETFCRYVANRTDKDNRRVNDDVMAEFELRKVKPSFERVRSELEILTALAEKVRSDSNAGKRVGESIINDYWNALTKPHQ